MDPFKTHDGQVMLLVLFPPGTCDVCGSKHASREPHNVRSVHYQFRFYMQYGRAATQADAIAHLEPPDRARWQKTIKLQRTWSEPLCEPIAEKSPRAGEAA